MKQASNNKKTWRVLSIDGGGMRGLYSAVYLSSLLKSFGDIRGETIDLGSAFNLICGTSTGAIIACALAADIPMTQVASMYREHGKAIFPKKVPGGFAGAVAQLLSRPGINKSGATALEAALKKVLKAKTVEQIWKERGIGLAIPAVEMSRHLAWVFKTPHLANSKNRDGKYSLVQVCMATSAAPIFRSMARLPDPHGDGTLVFSDGGLWANSPILVGLIDALEMSKLGDRIEIYSLGTCPPPSGDEIPEGTEDWGLLEWKLGGKVPAVAISAQQYAFNQMARLLSHHVDRDVQLIHFPNGAIQPSLFKHLDLDETSDASMNALTAQAHTDASQALSACGDANDSNGCALDNLFRTAPARKANASV